MSKGGLLERLRGATRPLHDELEDRVDIGARLRSFARYTDHLTRLWRLHVTAEQALCAVDFAPLGFSYPYPYRSSLLEDDLTFLGIGTEGLGPEGLPDPPALKTVAQGLGCMYVVEGSAKGARTILPAIKTSLDLDAAHGASFFYGFGKETGRLWRACVAGIEAIDPRSDDGDALVRTAQETFVFFRAGLIAETAADAFGAPDDPRCDPAGRPSAAGLRSGHDSRR